ncbi:MAG: aminomethyl-transferring glycine dehydrogenase subunit GcvPB [Nitrososphaerota archaeon]
MKLLQVGEEKMKRYHQAVWDEPIIFEIGQKGARGCTIPEAEEEIKAAVGDVLSTIPPKMRRKQPPELPEVSEPEVTRHYLRLSQQALGELGLQIGHGTSTVKYNPKVNEALARSPQMADIHPLQDDSTVQGILEVLYKASRWLCEIAGMDQLTFQPAGGAHAEFTMAAIVRAYHRYNGELDRRTEMIVPIKSHPGDASSSAVAGFKVVAVYPDETGTVPVEAVKAAVSKHTAGMMMTNPQEYSIFDRNVEEHAKIVHEVGGLMCYDMANFNGLLGVTRAGDMGFDMGHFNIHKTFASPHGSSGPGCGPVCVKERLGMFLPVPVVEFDGSRYYLDYDRPYSIGKVRGFYGNVSNVLRAYAWMMTLGAEGLREVAEVATLNANYLTKKLAELRGIEPLMGVNPYRPRLGQAEFSLDQLKRDTGIGLKEVNMRMIDHGMLPCETGHTPYLLTENPCALEPTESVSKRDLDEYIEAFRQTLEEAYTKPDIVKTAPHSTAISRVDTSVAYKPEEWALTWRAYKKKHKIPKDTCRRYEIGSYV